MATANIYDLADTWNNVATTYTAIKMNVTDTASASDSLLMALQVGGVDQLRVTKSGQTIVPVSASATTPGYAFDDGKAGIAYIGTTLRIIGGNNSLWTNIGNEYIQINSTLAQIYLGSDLFFGRRGAANLRFGAADAAAPVAQTLSVQSVVAGTTNTAGQNFTITGSQGTGTGAAGNILFQTSSAGSSGTSQNALATIMTLGPNTLTGSQATSLVDLAQTWNTSGTPAAIKLNITDTASASRSTFVSCNIGSSPVYQVTKSGEIVISNTAFTSLGGLRRAGNDGEMALTSQIDPNTGVPADVMRFYWDGVAVGSAAGSAAVLRGMGTNRFSIESSAAMVHIAQNSRFEWEGLGSQRLLWVSYQAGSSNHRSIDINLSGTVDDGSPLPLLSLSGASGRTNDLLALGQFNGSTWTTYSRFDYTGKLFGTSADLSGQLSFNSDLFLTRRAAANLCLGDADAAAPVAQTLGVQSVVAGTTNTAGANFTIAGSQGTGSGVAGNIIFQTSSAGSSGSAQNALGTILTIGPNTVTGSQSTPALTLAQTWNTSGSPVGLSIDITNTSGGTGNPFRITVGGAAVFSVFQNGGAVAIGSGTGTQIGARTVSDAVSRAVVGLSSTDEGIFALGPGGSSARDTILVRDAANTLALRNSTNAQAFNIYNTYTDASNYERGFVKWDTNVLKIGTEKLGTGTARALEFQTDGTTRLTIATNGDVTVAGLMNISSSGIRASSTGYGLFWSNSTTFNNRADGVLTISNYAENGFGRLQFGGTTSSFPALKRSTTSLQVRLADDSDYTNIQGKLTTETAYTAGAPTATGYIVLYDSTGTAYKVPAEAL